MGSHILCHRDCRGIAGIYGRGGRRGEYCGILVLPVRRYLCGLAAAGAFCGQKAIAINPLARHADFHGMDTVRAPANKVLGNTRSQS